MFLIVYEDGVLGLVQSVDEIGDNHTVVTLILKLEPDEAGFVRQILDTPNVSSLALARIVMKSFNRGYSHGGKKQRERSVEVH